MPNYDATFRLAPRVAMSITAKPQKPVKPKGDSTRAEFIKKGRVKWKTRGWKWNPAKVEALFDRIDTNKDGIASGMEKKAYWAKVMKVEQKLP